VATTINIPLDKVKAALMQSGTFDIIDASLESYIAGIVGYMIGAGVPETAFSDPTDEIINVIALGVIDTWQNQGDVRAFFKERVVQLRAVSDVST
jgi:hypothetical protein